MLGINLNITFAPLTKLHLPLLLQWLQAPHVKEWWDQDIAWTPELIEQKYGTHVEGYQVEDGVRKPIYAYIIQVDTTPIGYIQYYDSHMFAPEPLYDTSTLPKSCARLDWYIGEAEFTGKGVGPKALTLFLQEYVFKAFENVVVDSDTANYRAIRAYEKAGFHTIRRVNKGEITLMIKSLDKDKEHRTAIIYITGKPGTGKYTIAKELEKHAFIVCDNQLVNNPIFQLLNYDGFSKIPMFAWNAVARIRNAVFDFIATEPHNSYVLTNNLYESEGDRKLYQQVETLASQRGSVFVPVRLLISEEEHLKRVTNPSRRDRWKSIDPEEVYNDISLLKINHPHLLELDVSNLSALQAAERVLHHIQGL